MSRSCKKFPITGWTTARSEKDDKRLEHRRWRAACREALTHGLWERAEWNLRGSIFRWAKDGRRWHSPAWAERMKRK